MTSPREQQATPEDWRLHRHPPSCKWVPGWWDPICSVCDQTKRELRGDADPQPQGW